MAENDYPRLSKPERHMLKRGGRAWITSDHALALDDALKAEQASLKQCRLDSAAMTKEYRATAARYITQLALAERQLARAMEGISDAISDLGWPSPNSAHRVLFGTQHDIAAMDKPEEPEPDIKGAMGRIASELIDNAVEEPPRPPLDDLYMNNSEGLDTDPDPEGADVDTRPRQKACRCGLPLSLTTSDNPAHCWAKYYKDYFHPNGTPECAPDSPELGKPEAGVDHEAARRLAINWLNPDGMTSWRMDTKDYDPIGRELITTITRAYLAQADELAAFKGKVEKVPHLNHMGPEFHAGCAKGNGRCLFEEPTDA